MPPQQQVATSSSNDSTGSDDRSPLRICCYGSSSNKTQERYLTEAYSLGCTLAKRGHTCVNGAGATGCMGAMNQGCLDSQGQVFGVIHEIFVEGKGSQWKEGCHDVFNQEGSSAELASLAVVGGDDLQERKRMLVKDAHALIVLPGGPGTFDELWEMACSRQIGFIDMPIVCVNVDGYYDSFAEMLQRAHEDGFLYKHPDEILVFEPTSEKAVQRVENIVAQNLQERTAGKVKTARKEVIKKKPSILSRMMSTYNLPYSLSSVVETERELPPSGTIQFAMTFAAGLAMGFLIQSRK